MSNISDVAGGISDSTSSIGGASNTIGVIGRLFGEFMTGFTLWFSSLTFIEFVLLIIIIVLTIVLLYLRGKVEGRLFWGKPKKKKQFN